MSEKHSGISAHLLDDTFVSRWSDSRPERSLSLREQDLKEGLHACLLDTRLTGEARRRRAQHFRLTHSPFKCVVDDVNATNDVFVVVEAIPNPDQGNAIPGETVTRLLPLSDLGILPDIDNGMYRQDLYAVNYESVLAFPGLVLVA